MTVHDSSEGAAFDLGLRLGNWVQEGMGRAGPVGFLDYLVVDVWGEGSFGVHQLLVHCQSLPAFWLFLQLNLTVFVVLFERFFFIGVLEFRVQVSLKKVGNFLFLWLFLLPFFLFLLFLFLFFKICFFFLWLKFHRSVKHLFFRLLRIGHIGGTFIIFILLFHFSFLSQPRATDFLSLTAGLFLFLLNFLFVFILFSGIFFRIDLLLLYQLCQCIFNSRHSN